MFFHPMKRRDFLAGGVALATLATVSPAATARKYRIGIIGAGAIGGALGKLWAEAGYPVMLSARDLGAVQTLAAAIGHGARAGTPRQAAAFGEVLLVSVPWGALAQIGKDHAREMRGKVVLDTCNPYVDRDGPQAQAALDKGAGLVDQQLLPGTRLVRAFNSILAREIPKHAHRAGEKAGIQLASNDKAALAVASKLVMDAGFDPVVVGDLAASKQFDPGTPYYPKTMTAREIRAAFTISR